MVRKAAHFALLALSLAPSVAGAQGEQSRLTGRVTDGSGGALPGATVTVTSPSLDTPLNAVTDAVGQYLVPALPPGSYTVRFEVSGFEARTRHAIVLRAGDIFILDEELALAPLTETVTVLGDAPAPPLPAPASPPPLVQPRPVVIPVPKEALASVCGPGQPTGDEPAVGRIVGHRDEPTRELYGHGDILVLDVGGDQDVTTGQNFVVRRRFRISDETAPLKNATFGEHTAGLIQVVETSTVSSVAVVVYACDEFMLGDRIEPFNALPELTTDRRGTPQFDEPARIIFGDDGRMMGSPQQLLVIDRGAKQGAVRGQRLTVFRRPRGDQGHVSTIAEAVVVAVRADAATIRLERANDAVMVGDLVALHR